MPLGEILSRSLPKLYNSVKPQTLTRAFEQASQAAVTSTQSKLILTQQQQANLRKMQIQRELDRHGQQQQGHEDGSFSGENHGRDSYRAATGMPQQGQTSVYDPTQSNTFRHHGHDEHKKDEARRRREDLYRGKKSGGSGSGVTTNNSDQTPAVLYGKMLQGGLNSESTDHQTVDQADDQRELAQFIPDLNDEYHTAPDTRDAFKRALANLPSEEVQAKLNSITHPGTISFADVENAGNQAKNGTFSKALKERRVWSGLEYEDAYRIGAANRSRNRGVLAVSQNKEKADTSIDQKIDQEIREAAQDEYAANAKYEAEIEKLIAPYRLKRDAEIQKINERRKLINEFRDVNQATSEAREFNRRNIRMVNFPFSENRFLEIIKGRPDPIAQLFSTFNRMFNYNNGHISGFSSFLARHGEHAPSVPYVSH